jgi:competence protein ComEC
MPLTVKFYNVEHGCCTHIITPNGMNLLVDIGTKCSKSICKHIKDKHLGDNRLNYLIITHPHLDHIQDLPNLYTYNIKPHTLRRPPSAFPLVAGRDFTTAQRNIIAKANELNNEYTSGVGWDANPCNKDYNGGVEITAFSPDSADENNDDLNTYSSVIIVKYGNFKIVLTGDNPKEILETMLGKNDFMSAVKNSDILLAPHHGRDSDFCEKFVECVNPRLTVISDSHIKYSTQEYAAQKYRNKTRGVNWNNEKRYVLTTRSDGTITLEFHNNGTWSIYTSTTEY